MAKKALSCSPFTWDQLERRAASIGVPIYTLIGAVLDHFTLQSARTWRAIESAAALKAEQHAQRRVRTPQQLWQRRHRRRSP